MAVELQGSWGSPADVPLSRRIMASSTSFRDHHQVCQLIDNDHDQWKGHLLHLRLGIVLSYLGIKASNIPSAHFEKSS